MRRSCLITLVVSLFLFTVIPTFAQNSAASLTRPRRVLSESPAVSQPPQIAPAANKQAAPASVAEEKSKIQKPESDSTVVTPKQGNQTAVILTPQIIHSRITEAERLLKSRPKQTALGTPATDFVTLAALEQTTGRVHLISLTKELFLTKGSEITLPSSLGSQLSVHVIRANGVNTAVTIFDQNGQSLIPLVVEFPIEKFGSFKEMAYYSSAHPALLSPELTATGRGYVRTMLDLAVTRLRERGMFISPQIVDVAERLCLVEHVDHDRFRKESLSTLFDEIHSLYGLNEMETYRYSVSSAGAGGMVQMIPWAYNLIRQRHPLAGLVPDFVTGMRNHGNALEAMLLYMQDTWNDLSANDDVKFALNNKLATEPELLAAGYNSNAAKLPLYLRRGGSSWRTLIPRETQMYLQIYKAVDGLVPMKPRTVTTLQASNQ